MKSLFRMSGHSGSLYALPDFHCSPETSQTAPVLLPGCHGCCHPGVVTISAHSLIFSTIVENILCAFQVLYHEFPSKCGPLRTLQAELRFVFSSIQLQSTCKSLCIVTPCLCTPACKSVFMSGSHFNCKLKRVQSVFSVFLSCLQEP